MIGPQILCILRTFGPLPSSAFRCLDMKKSSVTNNLSRMKKYGEVRSSPGKHRRNLWDAL